MNYKLLFPTYRTRYLFVQESLRRLGSDGKFHNALNLGSGEGDYDPMIAGHCEHLTSCDINADDISFAREANSQVANLVYKVAGAMDLEFPSDHFDLVISVDVLEHVEDPQRMIQEVARVLAPGGLALISFPQVRFPITYDPINALFGRKVLSIGAYAFGHETLINPALFEQWISAQGMERISSENLSGHLVGLTELYWPGVLQGLLKANSKNLTDEVSTKGKLRPTSKEPALVFLTDTLISLDRALFRNCTASVGQGFVLRKSRSS